MKFDVANLIRVTDREALRKIGCDHSKVVLRKWHCLGRYPRLFVKLGNGLYVDKSEWENIVAEAFRARDERAAEFESMNTGKLPAVA